MRVCNERENSPKFLITHMFSSKEGILNQWRSLTGSTGTPKSLRLCLSYKERKTFGGCLHVTQPVSVQQIGGFCSSFKPVFLSSTLFCLPQIIMSSLIFCYFWMLILTNGICWPESEANWVNSIMFPLLSFSNINVQYNKHLIWRTLKEKCFLEVVRYLIFDVVTVELFGHPRNISWK